MAYVSGLQSQEVGACIKHFVCNDSEYERRTISIDADWLTAGDGVSRGLTIEFFYNGDLSGDPIHTEVTERMHLGWFGDHPSYGGLETFSLRLKGTFTVPETGAYTFGLLTTGRSRLLVDGVVCINDWTPSAHKGPFFEPGDFEKTTEIELATGQSADSTPPPRGTRAGGRRFGERLSFCPLTSSPRQPE